MKTVRHHYHGESPSTLHHAGEKSLNGVDGAVNGSIVSAQYSVPTDVGEPAHRWSVGHDHLSVPPGAEIGMSGMILLPNPTHTNNYFTGANGRGEYREKIKRGDSTRAPGSNTNSNRLGVGVDKEGRASSSSFAGGKEPPIRGLGGLTTTTLLKLVRRYAPPLPTPRILRFAEYDPSSAMAIPSIKLLSSYIKVKDQTYVM